MKKKPSEAELTILAVLWQHQPCSIRFVHDQLCEQNQTGYTTTQKQMQRMTEQGMISRSGKNKSFVYQALLSESEVKASAFDRLYSSLFKGSALDMVQYLVGRKQPSAAEMEEIRKLVDTYEENRKP